MQSIKNMFVEFDRLLDNNEAVKCTLSVLDIIATSFILLYHTISWINTVYMDINPRYSILLSSHLELIGMVVFTFSSGYKLMNNHYHDIFTKSFQGNYLLKRITKLYSDYILYPIICIIIMKFIFLVQINERVSPYMSFIFDPDDRTIVKALLSSNLPIAGHLWYIYVLIIINIIVFVLISFLNRYIFGILLPLLIYMFCSHHILQAYGYEELPFYVLTYLTIFMSGFSFSYLFKAKVIIRNRLIIVIMDSLCFMIFFWLIRIIKVPIFVWNNRILYGITVPLVMFASVLLSINILSCLFKGIQWLRKKTLIVYMIQYPFAIPFFCRLFRSLHWGISTMLVFFGTWIVSCMIQKFLDLLLDKVKNLYGINSVN